MAFASAVPLIVGVVSVVVVPFVGTWMTTGAGGAVVSMVKVLALESVETLPATSVARARTVCEPTASWVDRIEKLPEAFVVPVPRSVAALVDPDGRERLGGARVPSGSGRW